MQDAESELNELKALAQNCGYWDDRDLREQIELAVRRGNVQRLAFFRNFFANVVAEIGVEVNPFLPDPDEGEVDMGDIELGELSTGGTVRIPCNAFRFNELIIAAPGLGKTVMVASQVKQLIGG